MKFIVFLFIIFGFSASLYADDGIDPLKVFWVGWENQVKSRRLSSEEYACQFSKKFSPSIIPKMIEDLRKDKNDKRFFAYAMVIVNWDHTQCRKILSLIANSSNQIDSTWAKDFIGELDSYEEAQKEGKKWK